ncbi:hypothetical protein ACWGPD_29300 [Streptomyces hirsutus]|uniref:hypothetical protein n=1 Tax=Streptomyces hirsutus TaxID=35620 RepID=UPI0033A34EAD
MRATAERVRPDGVLGPVEIIWHVPADPASCDGDYPPVACGEPGISVPGGIREVPEKLTEPGRRWCTACRTSTQRTT